jgi:hypothetical protein
MGFVRVLAQLSHQPEDRANITQLQSLRHVLIPFLVEMQLTHPLILLHFTPKSNQKYRVLQGVLQDTTP